MSPERWLVWADRAYFGMAIIAAIATGLTIIAGIWQNRLNARISDMKDRAFADFRLTTEADARAMNAAIAEANARAAEANRIAEQERLARVKIEERLAPRRLSDEQTVRIARRLSKLARLPVGDKRQSVAVFPVGSSFESAALADQIAGILGEDGAGWDVSRYPVTYGHSFSLAGVGVLTSANPRGVSVASDFIEALNREGILSFMLPDRRNGCEEIPDFKGDVNADPFCSAVSVFVGDHP